MPTRPRRRLRGGDWTHDAARFFKGEYNQDINRAFENTFDPNKNGLARAFSPDEMKRNLENIFDPNKNGFNKAMVDIGNSVKNTLGNEGWWKATMTDPQTYITILGAIASVAAMVATAGAVNPATIAILSAATNASLTASSLVIDAVEGKPFDPLKLADIAIALVPIPGAPAVKGVASNVAKKSMMAMAKEAALGASHLNKTQKAAVAAKNALAIVRMGRGEELTPDELHEAGMLTPTEVEEIVEKEEGVVLNEMKSAFVEQMGNYDSNTQLLLIDSSLNDVYGTPDYPLVHRAWRELVEVRFPELKTGFDYYNARREGTEFTGNRENVFNARGENPTTLEGWKTKLRQEHPDWEDWEIENEAQQQIQQMSYLTGQGRRKQKPTHSQMLRHRKGGMEQRPPPIRRPPRSYVSTPTIEQISGSTPTFSSDSSRSSTPGQRPVPLNWALPPAFGQQIGFQNALPMPRPVQQVGINQPIQFDGAIPIPQRLQPHLGFQFAPSPASTASDASMRGSPSSDVSMGRGFYENTARSWALKHQARQALERQARNKIRVATGLLSEYHSTER